MNAFFLMKIDIIYNDCKVRLSLQHFIILWVYMIISTDIGLNGRLGNVLFKYAAMKGLAHHLNTEAKLSHTVEHHATHGQSWPLGYFNVNPSYYYDTHTIQHTFTDPYTDSYYPCFWDLPDNTNLLGWFQCEKYFKNVENIIRKEFELRSDIQQIVDLKFKDIQEQYPGKTLIAIHMRRGDDNENNHRIYAPDHMERGCWLHDFLSKAFEKFDDIGIEDKVFVLFTGGSHNNNNQHDVEWCKNNLNALFPYTFIVSETNDYIIDFGLIQKCNHVILNSISSFGWWAAYLNKNEKKRIVVPGYIPDPVLSKLRLDVYWPENFIQIPMK